MDLPLAVGLPGGGAHEPGGALSVAAAPNHATAESTVGEKGGFGVEIGAGDGPQTGGGFVRKAPIGVWNQIEDGLFHGRPGDQKAIRILLQ